MISVVRVTSVGVTSVGVTSVSVTSVGVTSVSVGATSASVVSVTSVVRVGRRMIVASHIDGSACRTEDSVVLFVRWYVESAPPRPPPVTVVFPAVLRVVLSVVCVGRVWCRRWRLLVLREKLLPVLLAIAIAVVVVIVAVVVAVVVIQV